MNGKLFYQDISKEASITGTDEAVNCPAANIQNDNPGLVWRSTFISQCEIKFTFQSPTAIKGIALFNTNFETGDTISFQASTDNFNNIAQNQAIDPEKGYIEVDWNYRYYRLVMQKSTGQYIQIGKAYLFQQLYAFEESFIYGYTRGKERFFSQKQTLSGQIYRKKRYSRNIFSCEFKNIPYSQVEKIEAAAECEYCCFQPFQESGFQFGCIDISTPKCIMSNCFDLTLNFQENPA